LARKTLRAYSAILIVRDFEWLAVGIKPSQKWWKPRIIELEHGISKWLVTHSEEIPALIPGIVLVLGFLTPFANQSLWPVRFLSSCIAFLFAILSAEVVNIISAEAVDTKHISATLNQNKENERET